PRLCVSRKSAGAKTHQANAPLSRQGMERQADSALLTVITGRPASLLRIHKLQPVSYPPVLKQKMVPQRFLSAVLVEGQDAVKITRLVNLVASRIPGLKPQGRTERGHAKEQPATGQETPVAERFELPSPKPRGRQQRWNCPNAYP